MKSSKKEKVLVSIHADLCKSCGYCREVCPQEIIESSENFNLHGYQYMVIANKEKCTGCLNCMVICPDFAVNVTEG